MGRSDQWFHKQGAKAGKAVSVASSLLNDRYRLVKTFQTTGAFRTYLAQDCYRPNRSLCVVKHLHGSAIDPAEWERVRMQLREEAETLDRLAHHEQIPQLLAFFEQGADSYLVEAYVQGEALTHELLQGCRWSVGQVLQFFQGVLPVLEFIHSRTVIHRHLKPDAILRRKDGSLMVIGFGDLQPGRSIPPVPTASIWIAPEQAYGSPCMSSDLYALGMIAVQALTGQDPASLRRDRTTGEICWQEEATVTPELATVIDRLVAYHFKDRYQSATEALIAVQSLTPHASIQLTQSLLTPVSKTVPAVVTLPFGSTSHSTIQPELEELSSFSWVTPATDLHPEIASPRKHKKWMVTGTTAGVLSAMAISSLIQNADRLVAIAPTPEATPEATPSTNDPAALTTVRSAPPPPPVQISSSRLPISSAVRMNAPVRTAAPVTPVMPVTPATPVAVVSENPSPGEVKSMVEETDRPSENPPVVAEEPAAIAPPEASQPVVMEPLYYRVMSILKGSPAELIPRLTQLSIAYETKGDLEAAVFFYERVIENQKLVYGDTHPELILSLSHLADLYQEMGNLEAAFPLYEQALALGQTMNAEDYPDLAARLQQITVPQVTVANEAIDPTPEVVEPTQPPDVATLPELPNTEDSVISESVEPAELERSVEPEPPTLPQEIAEEVKPDVSEVSAPAKVSSLTNQS